LSIERLKKRLGIDIDEKETQVILKNLGIKTTKKGNDILCEIPSWRQDISEEADLSEEVIRIKGYDSLPTLDIRSPDKVNKLILNESQKRISRAKRLLVSKSYNELITWSFSSSEDSSFYNNLDNLKILNPISEELDVLRPSLVPNLISAVKKNLARDHSSFSFFEIGNQFLSSNPGDQVCVACGVRAGIKQAKDWRDQENLYDIYDVKRDMIDVINHILPQKNKLEVIKEAPIWYHPGRSGTLMLNKSIKVGFFGELNPKIVNFYKIKDRINLFEIFLDDVPFISKKSTNKSAFNQSNYQKVYRDFAFVVDSNIDGNDIVLSALKVDQNLIKSVDIFDIFTDPSLGKDKKSLAIKVTMQAEDRTLSENDIQDLCSKIISTIEKETSGTVRS
jgi:phenylalanyl-tRNA synthetase beta chain